MYGFVGRERFCEIFKGRAVMVPELPAGRSRVLAHTANKTAGRDDTSLRTKSEYLALFDLLMAHVPPAATAELRLLDEAGRPTAAARVIEDYIAASRGKPEFFDADMYMFHITGFQPGHGVLTEPVKPGYGARLPIRFTYQDRQSLSTMYGPDGLAAIVSAAIEASPVQAVSFTVEVHQVEGRLPLGDAAWLFRHWRDTTNAERMNYWLSVLSDNAMLISQNAVEPSRVTKPQPPSG